MKIAFCAVLAASSIGFTCPSLAQQPKPVTREEAQALFAQIKEPCAAGSTRKACGILIYSPEDCNQTKEPHIRLIFQTYDDGAVRFQQNDTGTQRARPGALLAGFGIFDKRGKTTRYTDPQFVSQQAFKDGKKSVTICGKTAHISGSDFDIPEMMQKFLKANP
jgi:hypothetical protein